MKFFCSRHIENINPFEPLSYHRDILPISDIKFSTYELFKFGGWDLSDIEKVYQAFEAGNEVQCNAGRQLALLQNKKTMTDEERKRPAAPPSIAR